MNHTLNSGQPIFLYPRVLTKVLAVLVGLVCPANYSWFASFDPNC
jgi:hypothetical protein